MNKTLTIHRKTENKARVSFFIGATLLLSFLPLVLADSHLPKGLLVAEEYNEQKAAEFLRNISFIIAFIAGMITLLSPCLLPLLPAYFAITFKEKRRITLYTFIFFIGFSIIFVVMGLLASVTGRSLGTLLGDKPWIIFIAGSLFILLGIMTFLGKGFSGLIMNKQASEDKFGVFLSGIIFAVGWSACIGPIIAGIILIASTLQNYFAAALLMIFYSLGIFFPLFILSFIYDKIPLKGINKINKPLKIGSLHTTILNVIAAVMFILLGLLFIFFKGTSVINKFQMFGLKPYFYSIQNRILESPKLISSLNMGGFIFLAVFVFFLVYFLRKEIKNKGNEDYKKTDSLEVKYE